jgi:mevalonate kinase
MSEIQASACAKIILFGEHAAVYGQPAIAVPVNSLQVTVSVTSHNHSEPTLEIIAHDISLHLTINEAALATHEDPLIGVVRQFLQHTKMSLPDARFNVRSEIPIASGLGSGAAIAAALIRAMMRFTGCQLETTTINAIVYESERFFHGNPSGIDNSVIVYEKPVYFIRDRTLDTLTIQQPFHFVIGDTGVPASTKVAVDHVSAVVESDPQQYQPVLNQIGALAASARLILESQSPNYAQLGSLMQNNHQLLQTLEVSSPALDHLVNAAINAGALGAKMSGGGMGGNMIALVEATQVQPVSAALLEAGAKHVYSTVLGHKP